MAAVLKTARGRELPRGFESHTLRLGQQKLPLTCLYPSQQRRAPAAAVCGCMPPRAAWCGWLCLIRAQVRPCRQTCGSSSGLVFGIVGCDFTWLIPGGILNAPLSLVLVSDYAFGIDPQEHVHAVACPLTHRFRQTIGTQLADGGARLQTVMAVLTPLPGNVADLRQPVRPHRQAAVPGRRSTDISDPTSPSPARPPTRCVAPSRPRSSVLAAHPAYRARQAVEQQLIDDAAARGWQREIERHTATRQRLHQLISELGESTDP